MSVIVQAEVQYLKLPNNAAIEKERCISPFVCKVYFITGLDGAVINNRAGKYWVRSPTPAPIQSVFLKLISKVCVPDRHMLFSIQLGFNVHIHSKLL